MWIETKTTLPPECITVNTKIDSGGQVRNEQELKRVGNLWFHPDGKMYVYYTPTHWWNNKQENN
jgi:hypothetical protein